MKNIIFNYMTIALYAIAISMFITPPLLFPFSGVACVAFGYLFVNTMINSSVSFLNASIKLFILFLCTYFYTFHLVFFVDYLDEFWQRILFVILNVMPYWIAGCTGFFFARKMTVLWQKLFVAVMVFWSMSVMLVHLGEPYILPAYYSSGLFLSDWVPDAFFVWLQNPEIVYLFVTFTSALILFATFSYKKWMPFVILSVVCVFGGSWQIYNRVKPLFSDIVSYTNFNQYDEKNNIVRILSIEPLAIEEDLYNSQRKKIEKNLEEFSRLLQSDKKIVIFSENSRWFKFSEHNGEAASNFEWIRRQAKLNKLDVLIQVRGTAQPNVPALLREDKSYYVLIQPNGTYSVSEKQRPVYMAEQTIARKSNGHWYEWERQGMQNGRPSVPLVTSFGLKITSVVCFDGVFASLLDSEQNQSSHLIMVGANLVDFHRTYATYRFEMASHITLGLAAARTMGLPYVYSVSNGGGFAYYPSQGQSISDTYNRPNKTGFNYWTIPIMEKNPLHVIKSHDMGWISLLVFLSLVGFVLLVEQFKLWMNRRIPEAREQCL